MKKNVGIFASAILLLSTLGACAPTSSVLGEPAATKPQTGGSHYAGFTSPAPLEQKYSQRGSHEVAYVEFDAANIPNRTIGVWYPRKLEKDGARYPMILVANGSDTKASSYKPFFERLASWGFIVVGNEVEHAGTGESSSATLDVLLNAPRGNILHGRIDTANIGIAGYSQGGAGAIRAVTDYGNSRSYKTLFTASAPYPLLAKNLRWGYDAGKIAIPYFMTAGTGLSDDSGAKDTSKSFGGVSPLSSLIENYNAIPGEVMKVRARATGAEHTDMQIRTDGYLTAWMRYQLQGDRDAASVFVGKDAEILSNRNWQDVQKNR